MVTKCLFLLASLLCGDKIIICGAAKNIGPAVDNLIQNVEKLGSRFADYRVIIHQNNSSDDTHRRLRSWSLQNRRVFYSATNLHENELPLSRIETIAKARNRTLELVEELGYQDYKYLLMADLDFLCEWPIEEMMRVVESPVEWDCVSANGLASVEDPFYYDRRALRYPLFAEGPELMGDSWWQEIEQRIYFSGSEWVPAYSAFGGMAIYHTASILGARYSGVVTEDLKRYYAQILGRPVQFRENSIREYWDPEKRSPVPLCCEHLTLHASMALRGHGKFFINPKMFLIPE